MKKLLKQLLAVTTAIMMAITLLPAMANAAGNSAEATEIKGFRIKKIAQKEKGKEDVEIPLQGAEFKYYKVYDINQTTGEISITDKFQTIKNDNDAKQLWTDLNNMIDEKQNFTTIQELTLANDLKNYIAKKGISAEMKEGKEDILTSDDKGLTNYAHNKTYGYYLIVETKAPKAQASETQNPTTYITGDPFFLAFPGTDETNGTWIYDVTSKPKANAKGISGPEKKIIKKNNDTIEVSKNDVRVGDYLQYQIKVRVPQFTEKSFKVTDNMPKITITDTMSKNLTFVKDEDHPVTVTVNGVTKTEKVGEKKDNVYTLTTGTPGSDDTYTAFTAILQANGGFTKDDCGKDVIITYYAQVKAINNSIASDLQNTASVKVNDDSDIPGDRTDSYTYGIQLTKTLAGVALGQDDKDDKIDKVYFDLYEKKNGIYEKVTDLGNVVSANKTDGAEIQYGQFVTTKNNPILIKGLSLGEYALKETKTVGGYTLLTKYVEFNLVDANLNGKLDDAEGNDTDSNILLKTVDNKKGFSMPGTGGMGTYIFTIGGLVVMAGAVLLLVSSKKKRA